MIGADEARWRSRVQADSPTSIFVIGGDADVRQSLLSVLRDGGHDAVGFGSLEAVPQADGPVPACLVAALGTTSAVADQLAGLRLAFSVPLVAVIERADVRVAVAALKAGAFDVVERPFAAADLLVTVERALGDEAQNDPEGARRRLARLTSRERDVLRGLVAGKINKTIGQELGISPRTVEVYRSHIMTKTGVGSLPSLLRLASQAGIEREDPTPV